MDYRLAMMCGTDIPIPQCQLVAHQPRIKEIALIGEQDFFVGAQCLCLNKSMFVEGKDVLANTTNFQIFMTIMSQKEAKDKKLATQQVCSILFPDYKVSFIGDRSMVFMKNGEQPIAIDENNFDNLQEILKMIFCSKDGPMDQQSFNPADEKAREIAEKLMRGRQRVAAQNGSSNASVFSQYLSILTVGLNSMSLQNLADLTMFQLYDLIERYNLYINWDLDIRSRLAGGKPDTKPDNWMKNIH